MDNRPSPTRRLARSRPAGASSSLMRPTAASRASAAANRQRANNAMTSTAAKKPVGGAGGVGTGNRATGSTARRGANVGISARSGAMSARSRPAAKSSIPRPRAAPKRPAWDVKGRLADMEELTHSLTDTVKTNEQTVAALKEQLNSRESQLRQIEEKKAAVAADLSVREEKLQAVTENKEKLEAELSAAKAEHARELDDLKQALRRAEADTEEWRDKCRARESEIDGLRRQLNLEEEKNRDKSASLESTQKELEYCQDQLKQKTEQIVNLETTVAERDDQIQFLEDKSQADENMRRKLHNTIQELKGNIRVFCRMRPPFTADGVADNFKFPDLTHNQIEVSTTQVSGISKQYDTNKKVEFSFDRVFKPGSTQQDVFNEVSDLVQSSLDGYNTCIFTYGQTGSGKTYTMEGPDAEDLNEETQGVIPRTVAKIWQEMERLNNKGWKFEMSCFYLEIYNENVYDLLALQKGSRDKKLDIKMDSKGQPSVPGLRVVQVRTPHQIFELLKVASQNRKTAATDSNERSSRSHSVFQLCLQGTNTVTEEQVQGLLNLVDLAGSERLNKSKSQGDRLKEAQAINKSLACLGDVIMALANKEKHVPFRNSKLTHLLSNSLGGNSKTLMFVNLSPESEHVSETLSSLRFAQKVNSCDIGTAKKTVKQKSLMNCNAATNANVLLNSFPNLQPSYFVTSDKSADFASVEPAVACDPVLFVCIMAYVEKNTWKINMRLVTLLQSGTASVGEPQQLAGWPVFNAKLLGMAINNSTDVSLARIFYMKINWFESFQSETTPFSRFVITVAATVRVTELADEWEQVCVLAFPVFRNEFGVASDPVYHRLLFTNGRAPLGTPRAFSTDVSVVRKQSRLAVSLLLWAETTGFTWRVADFLLSQPTGFPEIYSFQPDIDAESLISDVARRADGTLEVIVQRTQGPVSRLVSIDSNGWASNYFSANILFKPLLTIGGPVDGARVLALSYTDDSRTTCVLRFDNRTSWRDPNPLFHHRFDISVIGVASDRIQAVLAGAYFKSLGVFFNVVDVSSSAAEMVMNSGIPTQRDLVLVATGFNESSGFISSSQLVLEDYRTMAADLTPIFVVIRELSPGMILIQVVFRAVSADFSSYRMFYVDLRSFVGMNSTMELESAVDSETGGSAEAITYLVSGTTPATTSASDSAFFSSVFDLGKESDDLAGSTSIIIGAVSAFFFVCFVVFVIGFVLQKQRRRRQRQHRQVPQKSKSNIDMLSMANGGNGGSGGGGGVLVKRRSSRSSSSRTRVGRNSGRFSVRNDSGGNNVPRNSNYDLISNVNVVDAGYVGVGNPYGALAVNHHGYESSPLDRKQLDYHLFCTACNHFFGSKHLLANHRCGH